MSDLFNYIKASPSWEKPNIRKRLLKPDEVLSLFGSLPHEVARTSGRKLDSGTKSTKELYKLGDPGQELVVKGWKESTALAKQQSVHELIGRVLVRRISERMPLRDSRPCIPGAIAYNTDEGPWLVTEFCRGDEINTDNIPRIPVDLRATIASSVLLSSVKTFPSSSVLFAEGDTPRASVIDLESVRFTEKEFLPDETTLLLLSLLVQA